jgi:NADPH:quinone reductase-like Zn-dependent oxidoreductase
MLALTAQPGTSDSLCVTDVPDPVPADDELLVAGIAVGVCGTAALHITYQGAKTKAQEFVPHKA